MKYLRIPVKLLSFLLATIFFYTLIMICLAGSIFGVNYEKYRGYLLRTWGKTCCLILGAKINVKNSAPEPPFLLISNHLSYIDVFVLFSQLRCLFVAKSDVKAWPLIGFLVRTCGILFVDRNKRRDVTRVNALISDNINDNQGIILFPEGTTSPGISLLPFKTSLLEYPASSNFPTHYVTITYESEPGAEPAYKTICWWDDTPFFVHFLSLLKLKGFRATLHFGEKPVCENDRKKLADQLHLEMNQQFKSVVKEQVFNHNHEEFSPLSI